MRVEVSRAESSTGQPAFQTRVRRPDSYTPNDATVPWRAVAVPVAALGVLLPGGREAAVHGFVCDQAALRLSDGMANGSACAVELPETMPAELAVMHGRLSAYHAERALGLLDYVAGLERRGLIAPGVAPLALSAWQAVSHLAGGLLPVPDACPGPNGELLYTWDRGEHHLELEIEEGEPPFLFYRNRLSHESWGADYAIGNPMPQEGRQRLRFFV